MDVFHCERYVIWMFFSLNVINLCYLDLFTLNVMIFVFNVRVTKKDVGILVILLKNIVKNSNL